MSKLAALVAEDEAPQREELCALLLELWPELDVTSCADGASALEIFESQRPQLLFLDIRMPGLSGLEVARAVSGSAQIVFVTAYDQHAIEAFERGAVDYLLKPIRRDRLELALQRVRARLSSGAVLDVAALVTGLQQQLGVRRRGLQWITATVGSTTRMFPIDDVLFFRAEDKYTRVSTASAEAHIRTTLKELLDGLDPETFWQVHRGVIVRASAIESAHRGDDGRLTLRVRGRDETLPVSQAFQHRFKSM